MPHYDHTQIITATTFESTTILRAESNRALSGPATNLAPTTNLKVSV
jgi:hypothetical protein